MLFISKMKKTVKNKKAFTLIELLIIMAILSILAAVSYTTLNKMRTQSQIENACNAVAAMINKTRNYDLLTYFKII